jgi:predicted DNA-binding transcriptional regulator AlpA
MVNPPGMIIPEIERRYGRSRATVKRWTTRPGWPKPIDKRGSWLEYDPAAVDEWVRKNIKRPPVELEPTRLYTAQQIEAAGAGVTAGTIRADLSRNRWPQPDSTDDNVNRWLGSTVQEALANRIYRRRPQ